MIPLDSPVVFDYMVENDQRVGSRALASPAARGKRPRSRQQRRTQRTVLKLLNAARTVFAEKGLDLARIDEITERADVGKGTFYYHFSSKEDVIGELIAGLLGELVAAIEDRCAGISNLRDLLDTMIGVHIEFFSSRWEDFVLYFHGRAELTLQDTYEGLETPFLQYLEHIEGLLGPVIRHQVPKPALRRLACAVAGFVSGYYSFAVISSQDEDIDDAFRSLRGAMASSLARFITEATASGALAPSGDTTV